MEWKGSSRKLAIVTAAVALMLCLPQIARAQDAPDPLKFTASGPVIVGWQIKAEKATDFETSWKGIRDLIGKSEDAALRAFGDSLTKLFKVDMAPFADASGNQTVIYLFQLDAPSTTYSYNPLTILYTYLAAGQDGSKVTRAEADDLYGKLQGSVLSINPLWKLVKVG
jgi:hypothetical protein